MSAQGLSLDDLCEIIATHGSPELKAAILQKQQELILVEKTKKLYHTIWILFANAILAMTIIVSLYNIYRAVPSVYFLLCVKICMLVFMLFSWIVAVKCDHIRYW